MNQPGITFNLNFSFLDILVKLVDWTRQKDNKLSDEEKEKIRYHCNEILKILPKPTNIKGKIKGQLNIPLYKQGN